MNLLSRLSPCLLYNQNGLSHSPVKSVKQIDFFSSNTELDSLAVFAAAFPAFPVFISEAVFFVSLAHFRNSVTHIFYNTHSIKNTRLPD